MSYLDRLKSARFTSSSGQTILFDYYELTRSSGKKGSIQELPNQDGGVLQSLGNKVMSYPIVAYFYGSNYDISADRMMEALRETGIGTLDHPRWGELKVIPFSFGQVEKFADGIRSSEITVEFIETTEQESPISTVEKKGKFLSKLDSFKKFATLDFLREFKLQNLIEKSTAMKEFNSLLSSLESGVDAIVQTRDEIKNQYDLIIRSIDRVTGLIDDAQTTIDSIVTLSFLGIGADDSISNIINTYSAILEEYQETYIAEPIRANLNTVVQMQVFGACAVGAIANAIIEYDFSNKAEAITVLNQMQSSFQSFIQNQDRLQEKFENSLITENYIMNSDTYNSLNEIVSITYSYILSQLYDLKTEQIITLDKEINPLALSWELYGTIDKLDALISDNDLSKYELFLLPIGKEIKIYV